MKSDVPFADRPEHGIGNGMRENIRIAVSLESARVRNLDSAQNERTSIDKTVNIVANTGKRHRVNNDQNRAPRSINPLEAHTLILSGLSSRGVISKRPPADSTRSLPAATSHKLTLDSR